jgi:hypothetical protein
MHAASHTFQYPKVTPVTPHGATATKPSAGASATQAGTKKPR